MTVEHEKRLGTIALRQNNGSAHLALTDLMTESVAMIGFIGLDHTRESVLECWDAMAVTARETLVEMLDRQEAVK